MSTQHLPLVIGVYSAVLGFFIPSGGGKWLLEAPYVMQAANELKVHLGWAVQIYNAAEALPNLINPFWMLPLLGILGLRARDIVGFTFLQLLVHLPLVLFLLWALRLHARVSPARHAVSLGRTERTGLHSRLRTADRAGRSDKCHRPEPPVGFSRDTLSGRDFGRRGSNDGGRFSRRRRASLGPSRTVEIESSTAQGTLVHEIMTEGPMFYQTPGDGIGECQALMAQRSVRPPACRRRGQCHWLLSICDGLGQIVGEEEHVIHDLETERLEMTTRRDRFKIIGTA